MRIFSIQPDGVFSEFTQEPFQVEHEEKTLENWIERNPDGVLEDEELLIIGRQVPTGLGGYIDLLGVARSGNVVVIELKRDRTPRETVAQALEYAAFAQRLDVRQLEILLNSYMNDESIILAEYHRQHFALDDGEAVAFNKDQQIVIVGQQVTPNVRQTAQFLNSKGVSVTCVEFSFFRAENGPRLLSQEIVVGGESAKATHAISQPGSAIDEKAFLESLDDNGKAVFSRLIAWSKENSMPFNWGVKGFSSGVVVDNVRVPVYFAYPPHSVYKQSLYTAFGGTGSIKSKVDVPEEAINEIKERAQATGMFMLAGQDVKCLVDRSMTDEEVNSLLNVCESIASAIQKYGLKQ